MTEQVYWIWLATRPGCGAKLCCRLLETFGSPEAVWRASHDQLSAAGSMTHARMDALMDKDIYGARRILEDCLRKNITVVTMEDAAYPAPLHSISDPPLVLYVRGTLPDFKNRLSISIVGTRTATQYGLRAARYFAGHLAQNGCIVVSGMALGIDGAANRAAVEAGGTTVAVLGSGVDVCYPWRHEGLMRDIINHGAVISEYPPGTEPAGKHFPVRNRIITGLSRGTLVVEAPRKSGALISADLALDQGRDVFAVPGDINRPSSAGCNALIRKGGAELVQSPSDILSCYGHPGRRTASVRKPAPREQVHPAVSQPLVFAPEEQPAPAKRRLEGTEQECAVWRAVHSGLHAVDAIVEHISLPASEVLTALTMLEVGAYVIRTEDGYHAADDVEI